MARQAKGFWVCRLALMESQDEARALRAKVAALEARAAVLARALTGLLNSPTIAARDTDMMRGCAETEKAVWQAQDAIQGADCGKTT